MLDTESQRMFEKYGGLGRGFYSFEVSTSWFERSWRHSVPTWELGVGRSVCVCVCVCSRTCMSCLCDQQTKVIWFIFSPVICCCRASTWLVWCIRTITRPWPWLLHSCNFFARWFSHSPASSYFFIVFSCPLPVCAVCVSCVGINSITTTDYFETMNLPHFSHKTVNKDTVVMTE